MLRIRILKIVHLVYTQFSLNFDTTRKSPAINFYCFSNTLEFNTLASDFEPGRFVTVRYSFKNVLVAEIFLYNLRHYGFSNVCHFSARHILDNRLIRHTRTS